jgi:hypothetical protein
MPSTINGLIVLLIAVIPGVPGETIFSAVTGLDWREDRLRRVIRIVLVSIAGLVLYVLADDLFNWLDAFNLADPHYINPGLYVEGITRDLLSEMIGAYVGHTIASTLAGAVFGFGWRATVTFSGATFYPAAWDDLINTHASDSWVIVTLTNGESYAGYIETADTEVRQEERDVILKEPAVYDADRGYVATQNQYLFLTSALIESVAVVYDADDGSETRLSEPGSVILNPTKANTTNDTNEQPEQ